MTSGEEVRLLKNPNYWNAAAVDIDRITMRAVTESGNRMLLMRSGDVDLVGDLTFDLFASFANVEGVALAFEDATYRHVGVQPTPCRRPESGSESQSRFGGGTLLVGYPAQARRDRHLFDGPRYQRIWPGAHSFRVGSSRPVRDGQRGGVYRAARVHRWFGQRARHAVGSDAQELVGELEQLRTRTPQQGTQPAPARAPPSRNRCIGRAKSGFRTP